MKPLLLSAVFLYYNAVSASAFDFWNYPEAADKHALFAGLLSPSLSFADGFAMTPPALTLDYIIPAGLPFSIGLFLVTPSPNLKSFGLRAAYHFNIGDEWTDLYFLYVFDFGWVRNSLLTAYNDTPVEVRYYDFRAGVRRRFGKFICFAIETNYHVSGFYFGLAAKLN
jgi:hypothetical protein